MDHTYSVILNGEISPYAKREDVITAFAKLAKLDPTKAEDIFNSAPITIKKDTDRDTAQKFAAALDKIGAGATLQPAIEQAQPLPTEAAPPSQAETADEQSEPQQQPCPGLTYTIEGQPDYAFLTVHIPANETLKVEASSMATMDTNLRMKTKFGGGFSRFLTGESIFINEFTAEGGPGEIGIAPGSPGDMAHVYLNGEALYLQNSAFVAATMDVAVESKWQGLAKGFFSGEKLFLIRAQGTGDVWFNTYGAIIEIDVQDQYVVDTGNIVAFTEGLEYNITKVGGYKSLFFSGEGFVCRFSGHGKVWIQTRGVTAFAGWAHWYRPAGSANG